MSNTFFQGGRKFLSGGLAPLNPPSYGPGLHSVADENEHGLEKNVLNKISRQSNLNRSAWLKLSMAALQ